MCNHKVTSLRSLQNNKSGVQAVATAARRLAWLEIAARGEGQLDIDKNAENRSTLALACKVTEREGKLGGGTSLSGPNSHSQVANTPC